jgi:hypothetical protein
MKSKQELKYILNNHPKLRWMDDKPDYFYFRGYYSLEHGEYARPNYKIVRYKDGWDIKRFDYHYNNDSACRINQQEKANILSECYYNQEIEHPEADEGYVNNKSGE